MKVTIIYFALLLSFFSSCDKESKSKNKITNYTIDLNDNTKWDLLEHIDSIAFIPLQSEEIFYPIPGRIRYNDKYIGYLIQEDPSNTELIIFDWEGNHINNFTTIYDSKDGLSTINDFALYRDTVYILNDDKISKYNIYDSKSPHNYYLDDIYTSFTRTIDGFILYNSTSPFLYQQITESGTRIADYISTALIPDNYTDYFNHFSNIYDSNDKFLFSNLSSQLYKLDWDQNKVVKDHYINIQDVIIDNETLTNLRMQGKEGSHKLENIILSGEHFFKYDNIMDLKEYRLYITKLHGKIYYFILNKINNSINTFSGVKNNTGFFFLHNSAGYLPIYGSVNMQHNDYILLLINSEDIHHYKDYLQDMKIGVKSNWEQMKNKVTDSYNPIMVLLKLKKFTN